MRQIYFNLKRRGFSIRDAKTRLGINKGQTTTDVVLQDVTFKVIESGRQRVLRTKEKNVHAFSVGTVVEGVDVSEATVPVSYNPYKAGHFVRKDTGEAIYSCRLLVMTTKLVDGKRQPMVLAAL
mgnify:CR=1 FL=1